MLKSNFVYKYWFLIIAIGMVIGCSKTFIETDPATGTDPVNLTTTTGACFVVTISQKNKDNLNIDNAFRIYRDIAYMPTRLQFFDSLVGKTDYDISISTISDTIKLSTGEYFLIDKGTKLVTTLFSKSDITDPNSDDKLCKYFYNALGSLLKKQIYFNGSTIPSYETSYEYNNNLLTNCLVTTGTQKATLLECSLTYDTTKIVKPWIYLFPDFFEGYNYLQAFNFGKKATSPISKIQTIIFDPNTGSKIDTWTTNFTGYVFSKDGFILQVSALGDQQQGIGLLYGTTRFDYMCSN